MQGRGKLVSRMPTQANVYTSKRAGSDLLYASSSRSGSESSDNDLSMASVEALNKASPNGSNVSLEKWLEEPTDNISSTAAASVAQLPSWTRNSSPTHKRGRKNVNRKITRNVKRARSVASRAGSASSAGTAKSSGSRGSSRSVDSRGSRRGRRQWKEYARNATHARTSTSMRQETEDDLEDEVVNYNRSRLFCTWTTCRQRFATAYEWIRHEQAIHYCPYRWTCYRCEGVDEEHRVFWRHDQLSQHVARVHIEKKLPKEIVNTWKIDNPAFDRQHLVCGFCGQALRTWQDRILHVKDHMNYGAEKRDWEADRPIGSLGPASARWPCRILAHPDSLIAHGPRHRYCSLCDESLMLFDVATHAATHFLMSCSQKEFDGFASFASHMIEHHGASASIWQRMDGFNEFLSSLECRPRFIDCCRAA